jgi:hypothetical protein
MEEEFYADRVQFQRLLQEYPHWKKRQYAEATGRSIGWVKKWKKRLLAAPDDPEVLRGLSRRPHQTPAPIHEAAVKRILPIRDQPPAAFALEVVFVRLTRMVYMECPEGTNSNRCM